MVGIFVRILRVRPAILAPITALITILGVYTINNSIFDIFVMIAFGVVGYLMKKTGFEPGPMVLAFVLGAILEDSVRRSAADLRRRPDWVRHPADLRHHPGGLRPRGAVAARSRCCSPPSPKSPGDGARRAEVGRLLPSERGPA